MSEIWGLDKCLTTKYALKTKEVRNSEILIVSLILIVRFYFYMLYNFLQNWLKDI